MLAGEGWEVEAVGSAEEALALLTSRSYNLVLTDIRMPGMDGLTLLGHIRKRYPDLRVVVMTVHNTPDHIVGSLRNEAAGYVRKPFSRDAFVDALQNALHTTLEHNDIKILSDRPQWISLEVRCKLSTADRLMPFVKELPGDVPPEEREQIATAFRELLMN